MNSHNIHKSNTNRWSEFPKLRPFSPNSKGERHVQGKENLQGGSRIISSKTLTVGKKGKRFRPEDMRVLGARREASRILKTDENRLSGHRTFSVQNEKKSLELVPYRMEDVQQDESQQSRVELAHDVIIVVLSYLTLRERVVASEVCKEWRDIASCPEYLLAAMMDEAQQLLGAPVRRLHLEGALASFGSVELRKCIFDGQTPPGLKTIRSAFYTIAGGDALGQIGKCLDLLDKIQDSDHYVDSASRCMDIMSGFFYSNPDLEVKTLFVNRLLSETRELAPWTRFRLNEALIERVHRLGAISEDLVRQLVQILDSYEVQFFRTHKLEVDRLGLLYGVLAGQLAQCNWVLHERYFDRLMEGIIYLPIQSQSRGWVRFCKALRYLEEGKRRTAIQRCLGWGTIFQQNPQGPTAAEYSVILSMCLGIAEILPSMSYPNFIECMRWILALCEDAPMDVPALLSLKTDLFSQLALGFRTRSYRDVHYYLPIFLDSIPEGDSRGKVAWALAKGILDKNLFRYGNILNRLKCVANQPMIQEVKAPLMAIIGEFEHRFQQFVVPYG